MSAAVFVDEAQAPILKRYERIAGICAPVPTTMFVTSTEWGQFADELAKLPAEVFTSPAKITKAAFSRLKILTLTIVNSGTEDQDVVNAANVEADRKANFRAKHDALAMRAGTKPADDAVDTRDTHEAPQELIKETIDRALVKRGEYAYKTIAGGPGSVA